MKLTDSNKYIVIDEYAPTPKYIQLTNSILSAIEAGYVNKDDTLPSICEMSNELEISKDTVEKSYRDLKKIGVLESIPGRGYYIMNTDFRQKSKICLLFNKISSYKKMVYDSFVTTVGEGVTTDLCIYNNDFTQFKKLIESKRDEYSHFVMMPQFTESAEIVAQVINTIPKHKLVILSEMIGGVTGDYAAVYEDFENDIYGALEKAVPALSKYHTIKLVFPNNSYYPKAITKGFIRFCQQYAFKFSLVPDIEVEPINEGEVCVILKEDDLVTFIERMKSTNFKIGKQVGLISYNEAPIKKIILNGISTISTDFSEMGKMAAKLIAGGSKMQLKVPFYLTLRATV
ncbi:HTH-type transcriptional repressor YtrA [compost metagenome]